MILSIPNDVTRLFFCGDIHGNLKYIKYFLNSNHIENACVVICGDVGLGFNINSELNTIKRINKYLAEHNNFVIAIRGNHDDPKLFTSTSLGNGNWVNVLDHTIVNVCGKKILCVGGGISIDRTYRVEGKTYWQDEVIEYLPKQDEKVDIIASHEAPNGVYPYVIGTIVTDLAANDPNLIRDVQDSRNTLTNIFNDYKNDITNWFYGHYHASHSDLLGDVNFTLLGINEVIEYDSNNNIY